MGQRRLDGSLRERAARRAWTGAAVEAALADVSGQGFAVVRGALGEADRADLLAEADAAGGFLAVPPTVNGVAQDGDQLTRRLDDHRFPSVRALAWSLCAGLRSVPDLYGQHRFAPTEARYMRYRGRTSGLGAHRDGSCYRIVVAVYSLAGTAPFTVVADSGAERPDAFLVGPGDVVLLRGPGFAGDPDGRRRHAVGPPLSGERVSLTLRMVGRHGVARARRRPRAG